MFQLKTIKPDGTSKLPLSVCFALEGKEHSINCRAAELRSFAKFRETVADRLAFWLGANYYAGRQETEDWEADVGTAFNAGNERKARDE